MGTTAVQIQNTKETFLMPPPPQTLHSHGLPDWRRATGMSAADSERQQVLTCGVDLSTYNIQLVRDF